MTTFVSPHPWPSPHDRLHEYKRAKTAGSFHPYHIPPLIDFSLDQNSISAHLVPTPSTVYLQHLLNSQLEVSTSHSQNETMPAARRASSRISATHSNKPSTQTNTIPATSSGTQLRNSPRNTASETRRTSERVVHAPSRYQMQPVPSSDEDEEDDEDDEGEKEDSPKSQPKRPLTLKLSKEKLQQVLEAVNKSAKPSGSNRAAFTTAAASSNTKSAASRSAPTSNFRSKSLTTSTSASRLSGRSRKAAVESDSDDEEDLDLADDDDPEPSDDSDGDDDEKDEEDEDEDEEDEEEEDEEDEDEDAEGEPDDQMDIDTVTPATLVARQASSGDEDAEGEDDDETMPDPLSSSLKNPQLGSSIKYQAGGIVPQLPIPAVVSPSSSSSELEDDEEEEEEEQEDEEDEDEEEEDSDEEMEYGTPGDFVGTPNVESGTETPDTSRLTKRQKGRISELYTADLEMLPDDFGSTKKAAPLTASEQASRRSEMARRRKNQSEQKREEEKMETINKLLKKQAPKLKGARGRPTAVTGDATPLDENGDTIPPEEPSEPPMMVRWVSNKDGERVGVPESWLSASVGEFYAKQSEPWRYGLGRKGLIVEIPEKMEVSA